MGVRLGSRDQTAKCGMAHKKFSSSEESTHEQIQGANYDYCFFDSRGIVHKEFVPAGQTVNHDFYKDVLERLRKRVQRVRTDIADLAPWDFYLFPKFKSKLKGHHFGTMENIKNCNR